MSGVYCEAHRAVVRASGSSRGVWIERHVAETTTGWREVWRRIVAAWHSLMGRRERIFVRPVGGGPWCWYGELDLIELGHESDEDERYEIQRLWYTKAEENNLPEFVGW